MKYAAIADWATDKQYSITFMCAQLGVVRQGYYRWLADGPCQRERTDAELTTQIRQIHSELHGHPGVRRVWAELVVRGVRAARKRVWRLMQGRRPAGTPPAGLEEDHRRRSTAYRCPGSDRAGFHRRAARHPLVWRHHLMGVSARWHQRPATFGQGAGRAAGGVITETSPVAADL